MAYIRERQTGTHRLSRGSIQTLSRESLCVSEYAEFLPRCKWIYTVYSDTHRLSRGSIEILVRERVCVSEYTDSLARCKWIYSVSSVTHRLSRRVCESVYMRHGIYVCHVIQTHAHTHTHTYTHTHTHTHTHKHTHAPHIDTRSWPLAYTYKDTQTHTHTQIQTRMWRTYICIPRLTKDIFTQNATPAKSTKSKNSDSSVSHDTNLDWDFGLI